MTRLVIINNLCEPYNRAIVQGIEPMCEHMLNRRMLHGHVLNCTSPSWALYTLSEFFEDRRYAHNYTILYEIRYSQGRFTTFMSPTGRVYCYSKTIYYE